jgi:hypothetical protein
MEKDKWYLKTTPPQIFGLMVDKKSFYKKRVVVQNKSNVLLNIFLYNT